MGATVLCEGHTVKWPWRKVGPGGIAHKVRAPKGPVAPPKAVLQPKTTEALEDDSGEATRRQHTAGGTSRGRSKREAKAR